MTNNQKIWIVFLVHICYTIEKRINALIEKGGSTNLTPITKMWDELIPKIHDYWKYGNEIIRRNHQFLSIDYDRVSQDKVFYLLFGAGISEIYAFNVCSGLAKINYFTMQNELFYFDDFGGKAFHFQDGELKPYFDKDRPERNQRNLDNFDKDFVKYFEKHIGNDFSKAENYFEVYLKSLVSSNIKS
ncbi:MAG: hypothetical protein ACOYMB_04440 [Patescibacteria group bacterium]